MLWPLPVLLGLIALGPFGIVARKQHYFPTDSLAGARRPKVINRDLRQFIDGLLGKGGIPGLSLGVVHSGGIVEVEGFGQSSEDGSRTTSETLFNIASCSKAFTASALGILMDDFAQGRNATSLPEGVKTFDWHTKVQDILTADWKLLDGWASQKASFRDILSHQSGLPGHDYSYTASDTPQDVVQRLRHLRPTFELRQRYQYNNLMYILASHVVSVYSGISFADFVQSRIWKPLNMSSSTYELDEAAKTGRLTEAWATNGRRIPNVFEQPGASFVAAGAGGVISSVEDLTKWIGTLLNGGINPVTNETILPTSVFEAITSGYILTSPRPQRHVPGPLSSLTAYGAGWERTSYRGHELIIHGGSITGFSSYVAFSPSARLGIAVLANGDLVHAQELAIIDKIFEDFLQAPPSLTVSYDIEPQSSFQTTAGHYDTPSFQDATDIVPLSRFAGTYSNAGYQDLTICDPKALMIVAACEDVLDIFSKFDDLSTSNNTLYAVFDNIVTSHIRFRRLSNTTFRAQTTSLYPHGYGRDKSAFELEVPAVAAGVVEFVFEDDRLVGAGLNFGQDDVSMRLRAGGGIKETAEVWYEKI